MTKNEETITVPVYVLKNIQRTLQLWSNTHHCYKLESCLARDTITNLLMLRKLLTGEELTGMERAEVCDRFNNNMEE
jgi:hypothetical protein